VGGVGAGDYVCCAGFDGDGVHKGIVGVLGRGLDLLPELGETRDYRVGIHVHRSCAGRLPEQHDSRGIAAKFLDVVVDPLDR
jgi:hypothetical protein